MRRIKVGVCDVEHQQKGERMAFAYHAGGIRPILTGARPGHQILTIRSRWDGVLQLMDVPRVKDEQWPSTGRSETSHSIKRQTIVASQVCSK